MLYHGSVVVLSGLLMVGIPEAPAKELPEAARTELKALQGNWRVAQFLHADRETTPDAGDDAVVVEFKGEAIDFAGSAAGAVVELSPAADPRCLDFKVRAGSGAFRTGETYESVYKLDGDTLTWAVYAGRGKNRPAAFDKPTDAGVMVMVLHRLKK